MVNGIAHTSIAKLGSGENDRDAGRLGVPGRGLAVVVEPLLGDRARRFASRPAGTL